MKVVLINGSPHEKGCTFTALTEVASTLNLNSIETEIFWIGTNPVRGCVACGSCRKTGRCVYEDDVCNQIIDLFTEANGIILGSPVYYAGPNGALCAILDRVFFAGSSSFKYKPAAAIASCRRAGAIASFDRLNKYFTINCMPVVSSQYWNDVHGSKPEDVQKDLEGMQIMRTLGHNMSWLLKNLAGEKTAIPILNEEKVRTNFIR